MFKNEEGLREHAGSRREKKAMLDDEGRVEDVEASCLITTDQEGRG